MKLTLLPGLNSYPIRKLLYSIRKGKFEPFRRRTTLYRSTPYSEHFINDTNNEARAQNFIE